MKYELKALGVEEVCITCQHFRTIEVNKLYRCMKYAFRRAWWRAKWISEGTFDKHYCS